MKKELVESLGRLAGEIVSGATNRPSVPQAPRQDKLSRFADIVMDGIVSALGENTGARSLGRTGGGQGGSASRRGCGGAGRGSGGGGRSGGGRQF